MRVPGRFGADSPGFKPRNQMVPHLPAISSDCSRYASHSGRHTDRSGEVMNGWFSFLGEMPFSTMRALASSTGLRRVVSGGQEPHLFGGEGAAAVCGFGMACAGAVLSTSFS